MDRATDEQLGNLHGMIAKEFATLLRKGVPTYNKDGEATGQFRRPTAAEYAVMVTFLSHNKISATVAQSDAIKDLNELLAKKRAKNRVSLEGLDMDLHDFIPGSADHAKGN